jgi:GntR family transcriptional regulator
MFEHLDPRSPVPLYDQIATRIRVAIAAGELTAGVALPSVRQVARQVRVNPATVVQAYRELEAEGFVELRQGAGTYVCEVEPAKRSAERLRQARRLARTMVTEAARLGLARKEIAQAIEQDLKGV